VALQTLVESEVDLSHPALTEQAGNANAAYTRANHRDIGKETILSNDLSH
jgi:hypothetical protein